ncbi:hypothetical protein [Acidianus brierleyi]|uniref:Uncharacterized protein n=1 Tax=Acidianus brierleyi TaxID=41673 RepID=A0A2U9IHT8_9CREN|nr:hypothetical protein [Acidianus brierleyi]AWR95504.1 hypothetical protein DFR85_13790 [Acidianus brierleyi]
MKKSFVICLVSLVFFSLSFYLHSIDHSTTIKLQNAIESPLAVKNISVFLSGVSTRLYDSSILLSVKNIYVSFSSPWYASLWLYFLTLGIIGLLSLAFIHRKTIIRALKNFTLFLIDHLDPVLN